MISAVRRQCRGSFVFSRFRLFIFGTISFGFLITIPVWAQTGVPLGDTASGNVIHEAPLQPHRPAADGTSGAALVTATGSEALFGNPAGFATDKIEYTALSADGWLYLRPVEAAPKLWDLLTSGNLSIPGMTGGLTSEYGAQGLGSGASATIGLSGRGLGLGLSVVTDGYFLGDSYPDNIGGHFQSEISFMGGFALTAHLFGAAISVGIDARPFARIHAVLDRTDAARVLPRVAAGDLSLSVLDGVPTLNGYGLGIDTGVQIKTGNIVVGASIRDVGGTRINYAVHNFETVMKYIGGAALPPTSMQTVDVSGYDYVVPMRIALGIAYHPDLGGATRYFDPQFFLSVPDVLPVFGGDTSLFNAVRAGVELRILSGLRLWGGIGVNHYSAGIGLRLFFMDLAVSGFEQVGPAVPRSSGISFEFAMRF